MSAAVLVATLGGTVGAAGLGELLPDGVTLARAALERARLVREDPVALARFLRVAPWTAVVGAALVLAGLPVAGLVAGAGPMAVRAALRSRQARRSRAVARGAPLVARAVADAVDAGHGARRALIEASRATAISGPAADELRRVAARLQAGDPLPAALAAWRERTGESAHVTLVAGLLLHGEAGGELADVLRDQADGLERARRATADADGATVQARAAARIVGGIPAVGLVGAVLLVPDTVRQVMGSFVGVALVSLAVVLQLAALVAVRRLTAGLGR